MNKTILLMESIVASGSIPYSSCKAYQGITPSTKLYRPCELSLITCATCVFNSNNSELVFTTAMENKSHE